MSDFLTNARAERTRQIKELNPQKGMFVNLLDEYGDVWHEIIDVFESALTIWKQVGSKSNEVKSDYTFFHKVRKVSPTLPDNARCIFKESGAYSERRCNLDELSR